MTAEQKLITVALNEVGYLEKATNKNLESKLDNAGRNNYTKYANFFDKQLPNFYNGKKNGYPWCDVFVDWCMVSTFGLDLAMEMLGQPPKSLGAGCKFSCDYYKQMCSFYNQPKVGDQVFFKDKSGSIIHTGLVYKVDDTYIYTVEGNTSTTAEVDANGGAVAKKKYKRTSTSIYGYGRPNYSLYKEEKPMAKLDNKPDAYAKNDVEWAKNNGIIKGDENGNLMLHSNITKQDALVFLRRLYNILMQNYK